VEPALTTLLDGTLVGFVPTSVIASAFRYLQSAAWLEGAERILPGCAPSQAEAPQSIIMVIAVFRVVSTTARQVRVSLRQWTMLLYA
jgi:hypothetical protein